MQFKSVPCWSTEIEVTLASLDLCPLGQKNHTVLLHNLAAGFQHRYDCGGNITDLKRAIEIFQAKLDLCSLGHPEYAITLGSLSTSLLKHYHIQQNEADLNRIIEMQERRLDLCPSGHPDHAKALGRLAGSLREHYCVHGHVADLNRIIEMGEKRLDLCPRGHQYHTEALGNLAVLLWDRYRKLGNLDDLNRGIDLEEKTLVLCPPGHRQHADALVNLAFSLRDCFNAMKNHSDLIRAIQLLKGALAIYEVQHHCFASTATSLAQATLLLFNSPCPNQSSSSLDKVFNAYKQLKKCGPAVSLNLLEGTQDWIWYAEEYNHSSVLEAYQLLLSTWDQFTSLSSSMDSRHQAMQAKVANLANDAFSCAIRHLVFKMAIELLEQGRGILWNQLARFDISIAELESQGTREHELGNKYRQLSTELREHTQGNGGKDAYWRVQQKWQSVVDEIRDLNGFSRFLLPPLFDDLQHAAELGPIIIVNASKHTCDALIALRTGSPVHVSLPCSFTDVDQLCSQLSELTRDAHAYGKHREIYVKEMLRDLWSSVVEPIAIVLQDKIRLPLGSQIWWCPTSKFTNLPFHAAGPHRNAEKNVFDLYVSSYAPSLSAFIQALDRIRAQRAAHDASKTLAPVSFAAVGQGRPSAKTNLRELPEVDREIYKIQNETGMPPDVTFDVVTGKAATIEGTVQTFRDHRWVHLACHGAQHAERPFDSGFAMGDGKLTLMRIIQERYTNSEFAFLSACHTAVGDASTPDEALHLAAGMQFAGFNGVIGTLWRVDDAVAHQVVTHFYKEMFKQPVIGFEHAAAALNAAVLKTAGQISLEKRIVFVHIGI